MEVSTYEALVEEERQHLQYRAEHYPDNYALVAHNREEGLLRINQKRSELTARFPYAVVAEGGYPEHDYARRWCWQNIGPEDGPCSSWQSDYPGCHLAHATEIIERRAWEDKSGEVYLYVRKRHSDPGEHSHEGAWRSWLLLGKNDYNFGFGEFYFANETDRQNFLAAFSTFNWSEDWDKIEQDRESVMEKQVEVQWVDSELEKSAKHILIVESDLLFSVRIETTLKKLGYRTTVIGNGAKAFGYIAESPAETAPALVIANFGSGRLDPLPFLEQLRSLSHPQLVLGFVPHGRLPEMRPLLKAAGCDLLVANSAIAAHLPKLVARLLPDSSTGNAPAPDDNTLAEIEAEADTED